MLRAGPLIELEALYFIGYYIYRSTDIILQRKISRLVLTTDKSNIEQPRLVGKVTAVFCLKTQITCYIISSYQTKTNTEH